mmetsp:Transcript_88185/g.175112  ORF Transcript_88185/g.175112 Transcript_88185/m.175112 type:complete len:286 (-) Transcript_88185:52-909(-)
MPSGDNLLLLKVPKWLSEAWILSPPHAVVADLDVEAGKLKLLSDPGVNRPSELCLERRASPELFAFPHADDKAGEVTVRGCIQESLHVQAQLNDSRYMNMLRQRCKDNDITANNRTLHMEKIQHPDQRPVAEKIVHSAGQETDVGVSDVTGPASAGEVHASYAVAKVPSQVDVAVAVERCLTASAKNGITCEALLAQLPFGCSLTSVRDALVALAELRELDGQRRFFPVQFHSRRHPPKTGKRQVKDMSASAGSQDGQNLSKLSRQGSPGPPRSTDGRHTGRVVP